MLLTPERLEQAGAGAKAGVAGLEHAVAAQDGLGDEGQMTKGLVVGRRHGRELRCSRAECGSGGSGELARSEQPRAANQEGVSQYCAFEQHRTAVWDVLTVEWSSDPGRGGATQRSASQSGPKPALGRTADLS